MAADAVDNRYNLNTESAVASNFATVIEPFWQQHAQTGHFKGVDDVQVHFAKLTHPDSQKLIMFAPGRTEGYLKYQELAWDFYNQGFSVFIIDHRGQGLSERMAKNSHKGHVNQFADYITDLKSFYNAHIQPLAIDKTFLVCHSMGGAIGIQYLLEYPEDFDKAVLSSPMMAFHSPIPRTMAEWLVESGTQLNKTLSNQPWYFPGQTNDIPIPFAINVLTQSKARYEMFNGIYNKYPQTKLGGVTFQWLSESSKALASFQRKAGENKVPVLLVQSGNDKVVDNAGQDEFFRNAANCELVKIDQAYHELFMEQDKYRIPAINKMLDFLLAE